MRTMNNTRRIDSLDNELMLSVMVDAMRKQFDSTLANIATVQQEGKQQHTGSFDLPDDCNH